MGRNRLRLRGALATVLALLAVPAGTGRAEEGRPVAGGRPNIVVIFCDDLGYGDLSCFGHPTIRTPHLDRMAAEGVRLTQFYVADCVCTPSRAGLLTGRYPVRSGMSGGRRRVLFPDSRGGLPADEVTMAEVLRDAGYRTACVGKWHLGHLPEYLPTRQGFDSYFGVPYSNDMDRRPADAVTDAERAAVASARYDVPLIRGEAVVERPADQTTLTARYTDEAIGFIGTSAERPFFLYLAHTFPHVPLFVGDARRGTSARGLYGDVVEELDASVGRLLDHLRATGLDRSTLVVFTSDNGPWLTQGDAGGSAGLLRSGKGSTWEGGMRVPMIAWWPGTIPAGRVEPGLATTLDLLPTAAALAGAELPEGRVRDGFDLTGLLAGTGASPRREVFFWRDGRFYAVRSGPWKMHRLTQEGYGQPTPAEPSPPELYHLEHDPSERFNVAKDHPEVIAALAKLAAEHEATIVPVPDQLAR